MKLMAIFVAVQTIKRSNIMEPRVSIIMGSTSDYKIMEAAAKHSMIFRFHLK